MRASKKGQGTAFPATTHTHTLSRLGDAVGGNDVARARFSAMVKTGRGEWGDVKAAVEKKDVSMLGGDRTPVRLGPHISRTCDPSPVGAQIPRHD